MATMSERARPRERAVFGARVRAERKTRGFSQEKLGDLCGMSGKFIGEVERGEKSISLDSLCRLALALKVAVRELADVDGREPVPEAEQAQAIVRGMKAGARKRAIRVLRELAA